MQAIKAKNTKPEMALRKALFALGLRYRLHEKRLPGRPDIVLPRFRTAVFIHGCFFHGHECETFRWPRSREAFWREKIEGNRARDRRQQKMLKDRGWNVVVVWECDLRGRGKACEVARRIKISMTSAKARRS